MARLLSPQGRLGVAAVDQGLASAAWYIPVLLVGRAASPAEFGVFLVGFGALATAVAVSRAMFGVVVGMDAAGLDEEVLGRTLRRTSAGVAVAGLLATVALAAASLLVTRSSAALLLLGVVAVPLLLQDLVRYTAVALVRPRAAVLADAVWLAPPSAALALDVAGILDLDAPTGLLVWVGATVLSVLVGTRSGLLSRPLFRGSLTWWREDRRRRELGGESLLSGVVPVANGWGAAVVGGAVAVASVRGAAMLFAPVMVLMLVLTLAAVPEARRRHPAGARGLLVALAAALVGCSVVWGLAAVSIPDDVGRSIIGRSWDVARPVLAWVWVENVGAALWVAGGAMLRYSGHTRSVWRLRLAYSPLAAALPVAALAAWGDPVAFAATLALIVWVVGPLACFLGYRSLTADAPRTSNVAGPSHRRDARGDAPDGED